MNIKLDNISKKYGKFKAISDLNCSIGNGMYGIIGRNGAGKTTLFRMIVGLISPTSGKILYNDGNKNFENKEIQKFIGYLPQDFGMYPDFTVLEIMQELCILRKIDKKERNIEIENLLDKVNLLNEKSKKYKELSGGMKRRLGLAQAMIGYPKILIVDEPTAGVDPKERVQIRRLLSEYAANHTVLLSTHLIEDIEYTCEEILILEKGNLVYIGNINALLLEASNNLGIKEFVNLDDFQKYSSNNTIFTFKRECNKIVSVVPKNFSDNKEFHITLEDAYMWKIDIGEKYE